MQKITASIAIDAPPSAVYRVVEDPTRMSAWVPSLVENHDVTGDGVGRKWSWTYKMIGIPLKGTTQVVAAEPDRTFRIQTSGGVRSKWDYYLEAREQGTLLNLAIEYEIPVPVLGKLAEKLVVNRNKREANDALHNLKELVEGAQPHPAG